ncbi:MAG TPA: acyl carrier protein [Azospirillum sp.]|nr:acyl carrier protein [Azospirillum sp.]
MSAPAPTIIPMITMIVEELGRIVAEKGAALPPLAADTAFLGGPLPIDSLDLATLLVVLEQRTGHDPFRAGFRQFTTVGELASLYSTDTLVEAP